MQLCDLNLSKYRELFMFVAGVIAFRYSRENMSACSCTWTLFGSESEDFVSAQWS
jgi:hypothetical protein